MTHSEGHEDQDTLPILEESLVIDKRKLVTGRMRVSTRTELVEELARASLTSSDVDVVRVQIGREVDSAPSIRVEGEVTIVPVLEEVLVVEKRLVLKEELHVHRRKTSRDVEEPVQLRKQHAVVERLDHLDQTEADQEE